MTNESIIKYSIIILVFLGSFFGTTYIIKNHINPKKTIHEIVLEVNKSCPKKISDEIILDSVNVIQKNFNYYYTLTLEDKDKMDVEKFESFIKPKLIEYYHKSQEKIILNKSQFNLVFHYQDAFHETISKIILTSKDYKK